ncbi:NHL repeat-containing protein [Roseivirga echinicomitans]|uniref:hypothetical protein n=1 Tax=Roseivirga echinicomitans TaxID=296218 RepID=UPI0012FD6A78|nr:hypothetical protein [Roseivirga echinicomitans]
MKTKTLLVTLLFLVMASGLSYVYFFKKDKGVEIQRLIPANSLGLITVNNVSEAIKDYSSYPWWDEANSLPFISRLTEANGKIDSLVKSGVLQSKINENPVYVSFHLTSNNSIDPLFFIGSDGFEWLPTNIKKLANLWFNKDLFFESRVFNEKLIYEANVQESTWGFISLGSYLVISTNSVLLEDVIRAEEDESSRLMKSELKMDENQKGVSLLLNTDRVGRLRNVFTGNNESSPNQLKGLINIKIEPSSAGLTFNGISLLNQEINQDLPSNALINVENFIPSSASFVRWFGIDESQNASLSGFDISLFQTLQNSEICEVNIVLGANTMSQVLLSEVSDVSKISKMLEEISKASRAEGDTLFTESFINNEIRFVNEEQFLVKTYGDRYQKSGKPYYAFFNNVMLISDNIDALKTVLVDYDAENTWGRIPEKRRYLDNLVREANITQLNNFEFYLDPLVNSFNPKWKAFFKDHIQLFSSFDNFNFQINEASSRLIVSAELTFNESVKRPLVRDSNRNSDPINPKIGLNLVTNAYGNGKLTTKPFVVKNHNNNAQEIIFQDELNQLYLVDRTGNILWKKELEGKINGAIEQIDFYANRKLQYLMFTDSAVYLIDRNGDDVEGFPMAFATELPITQYSVVDYDNSKNYRYATTDRRGNVYLLSKEGEMLEGWSPKVMGSALRGVPEHIRIRGRDCFVIVEANGNIHLLNRKGEEYPGFPYKTDKQISGDYFIQQGPSFNESYIKVLSEDGELLSLDFNGSVKGRNQLVKPSVSSRFIAVRDKLNTGLLTVRKDSNQFTVFDEKGQRKFGYDFKGQGDWAFEYYNFRNDSELYVAQNLTTGDLVILDDQGREKFSQEAFSINPIGILYYQNKREYELFVNFDNQMAIYTFTK